MPFRPIKTKEVSLLALAILPQAKRKATVQQQSSIFSYDAIVAHSQKGFPDTTCRGFLQVLWVHNSPLGCADPKDLLRPRGRHNKLMHKSQLYTLMLTAIVKHIRAGCAQTYRSPSPPLTSITTKLLLLAAFCGYSKGATN